MGWRVNITIREYIFSLGLAGDDSITGQPFDHWTSFDVYIEQD